MASTRSRSRPARLAQGAHIQVRSKPTGWRREPPSAAGTQRRKSRPTKKMRRSHERQWDPRWRWDVDGDGAGWQLHHTDRDGKAFLAYKVTEEKKKEIDKLHDDNFLVPTWWKLKGAKYSPIMALVARSITLHPCIELHVGEATSRTLAILSRKNATVWNPSVMNDLMFLRSNRDITK